MTVAKLARIGAPLAPDAAEVEAHISALERMARGRGLVARRARAAVQAFRKLRSEAFMRVYIGREAEIEEALAEAGAPVAGTLHILRKLAAQLSDKSQRVQLTQAEFGKLLRLTPAQTSRTFKALAEAGAILLPRAAGKSQTWEVDATYCSCMPEPARQAEAKRQEVEAEAEARQAAAKAAGAKLKLREVEGGIVDDARQLPLLDDGR